MSCFANGVQLRKTKYLLSAASAFKNHVQLKSFDDQGWILFIVGEKNDEKCRRKGKNVISSLRRECKCKLIAAVDLTKKAAQNIKEPQNLVSKSEHNKT